MTRVDLEATTAEDPGAWLLFLETKAFARLNDPATVDRITSVFPRPISSARIPPLASLDSMDLTPLIIC